MPNLCRIFNKTIPKLYQKYAESMPNQCINCRHQFGIISVQYFFSIKRIESLVFIDVGTADLAILIYVRKAKLIAKPLMLFTRK